MMNESKTIHAFERAGLGRAPFKFVAIEERRGPVKWYDEYGIEHGSFYADCSACGVQEDK